MMEVMPELPEVETVRRGLAPHIEGKRIVDFTLHRADLRFPFPKGFKKRMHGAQVKSFARRAKYLLADMQDAHGASFTWLSHLGMTGRFMCLCRNRAIWSPALMHEVTAQTAQKHIHVEIGFDDGTHLSFADPRRFGFMDCFTGDMSASPFLAALGPEPLGNDFNETGLLAAAQGRKTPVKNFLLDQNVVAGLGNIYVCEALFIAGISPRRQAAIWGPNALRVWCRPCVAFWRAPLRRVARPCAISPMRMVLWVISSTNLPSMAARAKPVQCLTVLLG